MQANNIQVGGNHYKKREYQHWDFVTDLRLPYLPANATKYAARWRDKNGIQDLQKCQHYIHKADERNVRWHIPEYATHEKFKSLAQFLDQFDGPDRELLRAIVFGQYLAANNIVVRLLMAAEEGVAHGGDGDQPRG